MKVLEKGRPQKGWSVEALCTGLGNGGGGCGAKLLVEEDDLFETTSSAMGEVDYHVTFKCCDCTVLTDIIPRHTVPSQVRDKLGKRARNQQSDPR